MSGSRFLFQFRNLLARIYPSSIPIQTQSVSTTARLSGSRRVVTTGDHIRLIPAHQRKIEQGIEGDLSSWISIDTSDVDRRMPTPETMKQLFNGIAYEDLPVVHIKVSKNNTIVAITDSRYKLITSTSCNKEGFKNARKKSTLAGQTVGVAAGQRLLRRGMDTVRVRIKGLGPGRMSCVKGMTVAGVNVVSITDATKLPELGPRPKNPRSV